MQKTFGAWLKEVYLDKYKITAYKLAKDTGIPSTIIGKLLKDQITLSVEKAILLAYYFNTSPEELLNSSNFYEVRKKKELIQIKNKLQHIQPLTVRDEEDG